MEGSEHEITPDDPRCPICGAVDWFSVSDLGLDYALTVIGKETREPVTFPGTSGPMLLPVEGFTCKSCRFIRLRATAGTLDWEDASGMREELQRLFGG